MSSMVRLYSVMIRCKEISSSMMHVFVVIAPRMVGDDYGVLETCLSRFKFSISGAKLRWASPLSVTFLDN